MRAMKVDGIRYTTPMAGSEDRTEKEKSEKRRKGGEKNHNNAFKKFRPHGIAQRSFILLFPAISPSFRSPHLTC